MDAIGGAAGAAGEADGTAHGGAGRGGGAGGNGAQGEGGTAALRRLGPLLAALRLAERVSRDVALAQSALAPTPALRRALRLQSRQEAMHAATFGAALALAGRRARCPPRLEAALGDYRRRLEADVAAGALAASMVGLQCVFECLGEVALQPPAGALARLGDRMVPLRALLLAQEEAHHQLGERWVPRLLGGAAAAKVAAVAAARSAYPDLALAAVDAGVEAFGEFEADGRGFAEAARLRLAGLARA